MKKYFPLVLRAWSLAMFFVVIMFLFATFTGDMDPIPGLRLFMSHDNYHWNYEAMFASLNIVWAIYLWKAAGNVSKYKTFIGFTGWANISHGLLMSLMALIQPNNYLDLLGSGILLIVLGAYFVYASNHTST